MGFLLRCFDKYEGEFGLKKRSILQRIEDIYRNLPDNILFRRKIKKLSENAWIWEYFSDLEDVGPDDEFEYVALKD